MTSKVEENEAEKLEVRDVEAEDFNERNHGRREQLSDSVGDGTDVDRRVEIRDQRRKIHVMPTPA